MRTVTNVPPTTDAVTSTALHAEPSPTTGDASSGTREAALQLANVSVRYGDRFALRHFSLHVDHGDFALVTGPSGCGKTTLARLLAGLLPRTVPATVEGTVRVDGLDPTQTGPAGMVGHVGIVFQNPSTQLFCLSVEEEVAFGPRNLGLAGQDVEERVSWALATCGLEHLRHRAPAELSGGERHRVTIAAALAMRPSTLLLDEPLAALDVISTRRLLDTLSELNRNEHTTILLFEHRLVEATRRVRRAIVMDEGALLADGSPDVVFADRILLRRLGLRRPTTVPGAAWNDLVAPTVKPSRRPDPLAILSDVHAGYSRKDVLRGINLAVYPGELVALVGENGSGKSTLARVLAGLMRPRGGSVNFLGKRPHPGLDVGLLFQDPLDQLLTDRIDDEVALGPQNWRCFDSERHQEILRACDLTALSSRSPHAVSAGQQQRAALAAVLALRPRLAILDEPTLGQDWRHLDRLATFLTQLKRSGSAILLITHDYKLAHHCADRIVVLSGGQVVGDGVLAHQATTSTQVEVLTQGGAP
jgi:energy-coupling factor transport system ATP-binding protein